MGADGREHGHEVVGIAGHEGAVALPGGRGGEVGVAGVHELHERRDGGVVLPAPVVVGALDAQAVHGAQELPALVVERVHGGLGARRRGA